MTTGTTTDSKTRWSVRVPSLDSLAVDNFGVMTLNGRPHRGYGFGGPAWERNPADIDAAPKITYLPDHATAFNYMLPPEPPIHLVPARDVDPTAIVDMVYRIALYPYRWGNDGTRRVLVMAAFARELNLWCIGRISIYG